MDFIKLVGGVIIIFLFVGGGLYFLNANVASGNIVADDQVETEQVFIQELTDKLNESYQVSRDEYKTMLQGETNPLDAIGFMILGGYRALAKIINIFGIMNDAIVMQLADKLLIPTFIIDAILVFILFSVTLTVIYMMFRFQPK